MVSKVADDGVAGGFAGYGLEEVQLETANVGDGILEKRHQIVERPHVETAADNANVLVCWRQARYFPSVNNRWWSASSMMTLRPPGSRGRRR